MPDTSGKLEAMNYYLLMMGGSGTRFGNSRPKQYTEIDNAPLFSYIIAKADTIAAIDHIVIVSNRDWLDYVEQWAKKTIVCKTYQIVEGGGNRSQSVKNGLCAIANQAKHEDVVMIHDATHPYVDEEGITQIIEAVQIYGGATLASKNYDTVYRTDAEGMLEKVEAREYIVAGASPEAFRFGDIYPIYMESSEEKLAAMTSAGAIALDHHIPMKVVPAKVLNLKITYPRDMELFLNLIHTYFFPGIREEEKGEGVECRIR